jgi:hypothetical protein
MCLKQSGTIGRSKNESKPHVNVNAFHARRFHDDDPSLENDDVGVASAVEDFGVDYVMGSVKRVSSGKTVIVPHLHTAKVHTPCRRKPHGPSCLLLLPPLPSPNC